MRTIEYDQTADALYVYIGKPKGDVKTKKVGSGVYADYDRNGAVVGVEILNASKKVLADMIDRAIPPTRLMTLAEAEEETGLSAITLRTQIRNGRLVATKKGRDWLVSSEDLAAYMESRHAPEPADYAMAGGSR